MKKANPRKRKPRGVPANQNDKSVSGGKLPASPAKRSPKTPDQPYLLSPEFLAGEEEETENLLAMERMLARARGFTLAFARVNMPSRRAELAQEIRRRMEPQGVEIVEVELSSPVQDVLAELRQRLQGKYFPWQEAEKPEFALAESSPRLAVFVYGLEHSLPSSEVYHPVLAVLNYKREGFRRYIPAPLVFWAPEFALQAVMEGAPDFWAWRSALFEFAAPQELVEKAWVATMPERGQTALSRLSGEEKRERIHLLSGLLAEYDARSDKDTPEIAPIRMDLAGRIGLLYYFLGEYDHALDFYRKGYAIAEKTDSREGIANFLHNSAMIYQQRGDYGAALEQYHQSLEIKEEIGDRAGAARTLHQIGNLYCLRGDYGAALEHYRQSVAIEEGELSNRAGVAQILHQIANLHYLRGEYGAALEQYHQSLKIKEEIGDRASVASTLHQIGMIHQDRGDYGAALEQYRQSLKIREEIGDRVGVASTLHQIGMIHQQRGDYGAALEHYRQSLATFEEIGDRANMAKVLHQIGIIHEDRGDYGAALKQYRQSLEIEEEVGNRAGVAESRAQIGKLFTETGEATSARYPEALEHLLFALAEFLQMQSPNAQIVLNMLKTLRGKWGAAHFDPAWQKATGEPWPGERKE